ncbi:MAG: hypothetical protein MJ219_04360 [Mycoplasmoidaceae bacterium]|nr:hypothetical protein [Mycoplasmoidaceae bacterium]
MHKFIAQTISGKEVTTPNSNAPPNDALSSVPNTEDQCVKINDSDVKVKKTAEIIKISDTTTIKTMTHFKRSLNNSDFLACIISVIPSLLWFGLVCG